MAGQESSIILLLQGLLQQVLGGNEDVVVTAGKKGPITDNAFFQLEVHTCLSPRSCIRFPFCCCHPHPAYTKLCGACGCVRACLNASVLWIVSQCELSSQKDFTAVESA